jgi:hypothetical protein
MAQNFQFSRAMVICAMLITAIMANGISSDKDSFTAFSSMSSSSLILPEASRIDLAYSSIFLSTLSSSKIPIKSTSQAVSESQSIISSTLSSFTPSEIATSQQLLRSSLHASSIPESLMPNQTGPITFAALISSRTIYSQQSTHPPSQEVSSFNPSLTMKSSSSTKPPISGNGFMLPSTSAPAGRVPSNQNETFTALCADKTNAQNTTSSQEVELEELVAEARNSTHPGISNPHAKIASAQLSQTLDCLVHNSSDVIPQTSAAQHLYGPPSGNLSSTDKIVSQGSLNNSIGIAITNDYAYPENCNVTYAGLLNITAAYQDVGAKTMASSIPIMTNLTHSPVENSSTSISRSKALIFLAAEHNQTSIAQFFNSSSSNTSIHLVTNGSVVDPRRTNASSTVLNVNSAINIFQNGTLPAGQNMSYGEESNRPLLRHNQTGISQSINSSVGAPSYLSSNQSRAEFGNGTIFVNPIRYNFTQAGLEQYSNVSIFSHFPFNVSTFENCQPAGKNPNTTHSLPASNQPQLTMGNFIQPDIASTNLSSFINFVFVNSTPENHILNADNYTFPYGLSSQNSSSHSRKILGNTSLSMGYLPSNLTIGQIASKTTFIRNGSINQPNNSTRALLSPSGNSTSIGLEISGRNASSLLKLAADTEIHNDNSSLLRNVNTTSATIEQTSNLKEPLAILKLLYDSSANSSSSIIISPSGTRYNLTDLHTDEDDLAFNKSLSSLDIFEDTTSTSHKSISFNDSGISFNKSDLSNSHKSIAAYNRTLLNNYGDNNYFTNKKETKVSMTECIDNTDYFAMTDANLVISNQDAWYKNWTERCRNDPVFRKYGEIRAFGREFLKDDDYECGLGLNGCTRRPSCKNVLSLYPDDANMARRVYFTMKKHHEINDAIKTYYVSFRGLLFLHHAQQRFLRTPPLQHNQMLQELLARLYA